jgi:NAD(P)H-quinone oxidoreductase subunit 5
MGLLTAFFAGLVMLTRVSIKLRLAWSTVGQMGFMIIECGLGLYSLAVMHLIGHSLYKAHTFLGASGVVEKFKIDQMKKPYQKLGISLIVAPFISVSIIILIQYYFANQSWPFWWSVVLGLAWSPMLWTASNRLKQTIIHMGFGFFTIIGLGFLATFLQVIDFGTNDINHELGLVIVSVVMSIMYILIALIQRCSENLALLQRWSYAGFYLDEIYTRLTLKIWPVDWVMLEKKSFEQKM